MMLQYDDDDGRVKRLFQILWYGLKYEMQCNQYENDHDIKQWKYLIGLVVLTIGNVVGQSKGNQRQGEAWCGEDL